MKTKSIVSGFSGSLLIVAFISGIWMPLAQNLVDIDMGSTLIENRKLAAFPDAPDSLASFDSYPQKFEAYFNDHFGFRNTLVFLNNLAQVKLFGNSSNARVIIGKEGWLYLKDKHVIDYYRCIKPLTQPQLKVWEEVLEDRRKWLKQRGIEFVVVFVPTKHNFYPEFLPDYIRHSGSKSRLDQLREHLKAHTEVHVIDLGIDLQKYKKRERLYYRTDSHWNNSGAFFATRAIMEHLSDRFPSLEPFPESDYEQSTETVKGRDLANMLGLQDVYSEELLKRKLKRPTQIQKLKEGVLVTYDKPTDESIQPFAKVQKTDHRPKAVIFRDSFFNNLLQFFAPYFRRSVYYWQYEFDCDVVEYEKPDIVFFEIVERELMRVRPKTPPRIKRDLRQ